MISKTAVVLIGFFLEMVYQATQQPALQSNQYPDNPPANSPRIRLGDGRRLAYREEGVPKNKAKYRIIIVHGFGSSKEMNFLAPQVQT